MKRILIFSLNYYPFVGGAEVAIKEITDRMPKDEMEFHLIAPWYDATLPKEERIGNVTVHRIGLRIAHPTIADLKKRPLNFNKKLYQILAVFEAERLHRQYHFDLIWAMIAHSCAIPAGIFKKRHREVKYLLTLQEGDPPEYIEKLMKPVWGLFKQGFTRADALQPISQFLLAWGRRMGFTGRAEVIPNAVDTKRFAAAPDPSALARMEETLGKKEGDVFLVTTSRLVRKNAVDDVIRALPFLPESVSFIIYGIGPDERDLKALATELGVESRTRFMGQVSHEELPRALFACDIFVRPSRSEGMGNSFIEAMAVGLPVIATQEGGIADFLFDAKRNPEKETTGWAVDANAPEQIAGAVKDIIAHPEQVVKVTRTAQELARSTYDWDLVAANMRNLFRELLAPPL
jgi:glycosyltransferase involved in cell wall biosynthesis